MELILSSEKCTACMACVMACSMHHIQRFDRTISSVQVSNFKKEREIQVRIHREIEKERKPCDGCQGEKKPLCAKYCVPQAIVFK